MIAAVRGEVLHKGLSSVVVDVQGLGLEVQVTPATVGGLHEGRQARLATTYVARKDDSPLLFGFADTQEKEVFETMLGVSGIGPRTALAVLATLGPDDVRQAIAAGDPKAFTAVPGIGPKGAKRIVLELADKLVPAEPSKAAAASPATEAPLWRMQVSEALVGLGWNEKDALHAIDDALEGREELVESGEVSAILRTVLAWLGARASTVSTHHSAGGSQGGATNTGKGA
ncbi:Holliday junction branch migration protein RuvA [Kocuria coralli]|uniref:Holliday junction branch migration complex subunit RuvA n=1 Tax=Kocuria coralli TaxID=1461025 RepID=A0A5J5KZK5_9MICC|nr:Holliday junction branch migration protein RuvA [Kocuria coralli]KAA9395114.1 Holliday junction branch migration protein RuvA [Kocuria coralli]